MDPTTPDAQQEEPLTKALELSADLLECCTKQATHIKDIEAKLQEKDTQIASLQAATKQASAPPVPLTFDTDKLDETLTFLQSQGFMSAPAKQAAFSDLSKDPNLALGLVTKLATFIQPMLDPQGHQTTISDRDGAKAPSRWY